MSNLSHDDRLLCEFQADLFEESLEKTACSSPVFLRRFMNSKAAWRMDQDGFLNSTEDIDTIFMAIEEEYGPSSYGKIRYSASELHWMGYLYRYWCQTRKIDSQKAYKIIKPSELRELYNAYHTMDPEQAIERILEGKNIVEEDPIERGVRIMRMVMKKRNML